MRWREPEAVAKRDVLTPNATPPPVVVSRSVSHPNSRSSIGSNSEQEREEGGEGERGEGEGKEGSSESQDELPSSSPPTPQLLVETLTASLKKVRHEVYNILTLLILVISYSGVRCLKPVPPHTTYT